MPSLQKYRAKRDFSKTAEPRGAARVKKGSRFVIQKHAASRLHYDLRLEVDGVMKSWAVAKGPSLVPGEKRLAIHVEDHPIEYNTFEGTIPKGEYGGGTVMIWDRGTWTPDDDPARGLKKGSLDFTLDGAKLNGRFHLVRMRPRPGERQEPWLLIKSSDEYARKASDPDILEEMSDSVATGRTMEQIAAGKRVWHSNRPAKVSKAAARLQKPGTTAMPKAARAKRKRTPAKRKSAARDDDDIASIPGARRAKLPDFVEPCLARLVDAAPSSSDWVHEIKFDGYRIQARVEDGKVTLKTRTGLDWTGRFPTVAEACGELQHDIVLDGEIVSSNQEGVSDFSALQDDLKNERYDRMVYYVFDVIHVDDTDLTRAALVDRKAVLYRIMADWPKDGTIRVSEHFEAEGPEILKHACEIHLEGIVCKRRDAPYHGGRIGDWLKAKCASNQEFVIAGFEPSDKKRRAIRSLLLGYYEDGTLRYAGRVGTGWGEKQERVLSDKLEPLIVDKHPFDKMPEAERRARVKWVKPQLVAEIDFRGWTGGALVRQGSFQGLREDKPAKDVVREDQTVASQVSSQSTASKHKAHAARGARQAPPRVAAPAKSGAVSVAGVALTHPERMYWDDADVNKQRLAEHYTQVWDFMKPHVVGRVLALVRCPEGVAGECFFQKHASAGLTEKYLRMVAEPDGDKAIAIDDLQGLISIVQAGALEIHVRGSTVDHLEEANRLIFDLDPGPGITWPMIVEAAFELRERLRQLKLESFVKNTGGKGLHVVLPIRHTPWDEAKTFCRKLAEQMVADSPDRYTATIKKAARPQKIFIDYLRNSREATAIAPYSTRARPGATVATPLTWEEVRKLKEPAPFKVENLDKRLGRLRKDPWANMDRHRPALPDVKKIQPASARLPARKRSS